MERVLKKEIMAIVPEYVEDRGNCTKVYANGQEPVILNRSIKTTLRLLGRYYMIDMEELKRRYQVYVPSRNLVPIPFSRKDVFIPFKTRKPVCKNDGAFGYINMKFIEKIKENDEYNAVYLSSGLYIPCLCSIETIEKHMINGRIISRCYENRSMMVNDEEVVYNARIYIDR